MNIDPNKYRWILIDEDGDVSGTNNEELAMDFSRGELNIVVDCLNQDLVYEEAIVSVDETKYEIHNEPSDEIEPHDGSDGVAEREG